VLGAKGFAMDVGAVCSGFVFALATADNFIRLGQVKNALVIGADQTLDFGSRRWTKPRSLGDARQQLLALSGNTHALHSAVAAARNGRIVWRHRDTAKLTMWTFGAKFVEGYLAQVGEAALTSLGAYQIEGLGLQLFERIEGDYFTILGLPLLAVLEGLRAEGFAED